MDEILHFIFWGIVEGILFRIGRMFLRALSLGRIRLDRPTPLQVFLVAILGFLIMLCGVFLLLAL